MAAGSAGPPAAGAARGITASRGRPDRQVALVTGAAQGLGRAIALRLAAEGFAVAANDIALTKGLGRELAPQGILANAIAPSFIDTEQLRVDAEDAGITLEEMRQRYREQIPVRRLATPEEIAGAIAFLAGPGSSAVVGQILQPNGGVTRTRA
jgi:NAD(P)-dependent dehydrogenase (short-subunit alcohol dehydrogenase family)